MSPSNNNNHIITNNNGSASKKLIKDQLTLAEVKLPDGDVKKEVRALVFLWVGKSRSPTPLTFFFLGLCVWGSGGGVRGGEMGTDGAWDAGEGGRE